MPDQDQMDGFMAAVQSAEANLSAEKQTEPCGRRAFAPARARRGEHG
tara:strand:- start:1356 stop:1496 length:141 start_codon:yes stop_codon:yes gene_type:complete